MTDRTIDNIRAVLLATAIGIFGAIGLAHWAACESDDSVCMFTGAAK